MALKTLISCFLSVCKVTTVSCVHVEVSPCCSLCVTSRNPASSPPQHKVLACLRVVPEGPGSESPGTAIESSGLTHEHFRQFHPLLPPEKFQSSSASQVGRASVSHSGTKMGSLDTTPLYAKLCPRITSLCSTSKFHLISSGTAYEEMSWNLCHGL